MTPIVVGTLIAVDHYKDIGEGTDEKMATMKESFILMSGNLGF